MPRPKKDSQAVRPVRMSPRNPWFGKIFMDDKGKTVNIEIDDEEEDLQAFLEEIEPDEGVEEYILRMCAVTKLPKYVPPRKGKVKLPKDVDTVKSALKTPLLLNEILFEGSVLGHVPTMKFEDWDLADNEKFPHLETSQLMKQSKEGVVTALQPQKWLHGVEEVGLLHLLWILHFHRSLTTIFVIRQLLCLVHERYLWLEEPIPITAELIHRISNLPYMGRDLTEIAGQS